MPTLAIHLDRQEKFEFNKETQLFPILGLIAAELNKDAPPAEDAEGKKNDEDKPFAPLTAITERHHPSVVKLISEATESAPEDVLDFEMLLYEGAEEPAVFLQQINGTVSVRCVTSRDDRTDRRQRVVRLPALCRGADRG